MSLVNDYRIGADPEFVLLKDGHLQRFTTHVPANSPWGLDHGGWVIEPHPKPDLSVRQVVNNLKIAMNDFALVAPDAKWRAGAHLAGPERPVSLGGHVHIDRPGYKPSDITGLDLFGQQLEGLDILPKGECA